MALAYRYEGERSFLLGPLSPPAGLHELATFFNELNCRYCQQTVGVFVAQTAGVGMISCIRCEDQAGPVVDDRPTPRNPPAWLIGAQSEVEASQSIRSNSSEFYKKFDAATQRVKTEMSPPAKGRLW